MDSMPIQTSARSRRLGTWVQLGMGFVVGVLALAWAVRGLDWKSVFAALVSAQYAWALVSLGCVVSVSFIKTVRWGVLYSASEYPNALGDLFTALMITHMVNVVIPIRVGELIRIGMMKQSGQPGATTLATIAVEKAVDLAAAGLIAVSLVVLAVAPLWLQDWASSVLVIGFVLMVGLVSVWYFRNWIEKFLDHVLAIGGWMPERWRKRLLRIARTMLEAFGTLVNLSAVVKVVFWTAVSWLFSLLAILALLAAFQLQLPFAVAVVLMLSLSFSNIVPSPPALVGVVQAIAVAVLGGYGVAQSVALGFGIVLNVVIVTPLILLGSLSLWHRAVSVLQLIRDHSLHSLWRRP